MFIYNNKDELTDIFNLCSNDDLKYKIGVR